MATKSTKSFLIQNTLLAAIAALLLINATGSQGEAANTKATTLCVQKNGNVVAKPKCSKGETKFSVMPGTVKTSPIKPYILGQNSRVSTQAIAPKSLSTLSILATTPRVFTRLITLPEGMFIDSLEDYSESFPSCPADAPLQTSWAVGLAPSVDPTLSSDRVFQTDNVNQVSFQITEIPGRQITTVFSPVESTTERETSTDLQLNFTKGPNMYDKVNFVLSYGGDSVTYGIGGYDPSKPNNNIVETSVFESVFPHDFAFYASVTCVPIVSLTP